MHLVSSGYNFFQFPNDNIMCSAYVMVFLMQMWKMTDYCPDVHFIRLNFCANSWCLWSLLLMRLLSRNVNLTSFPMLSSQLQCSQSSMMWIQPSAKRGRYCCYVLWSSQWSGFNPQLEQIFFFFLIVGMESARPVITMLTWQFSECSGSWESNSTMNRINYLKLNVVV